MDASEAEGRAASRGAEQTPSVSLSAPAAIVEGLPDAVVVAGRDGRIVFLNALAEELFGYDRDELLGEPVALLWADRFRERYTRNMRLYFEIEHPLSFSAEVWGRRRDGSEFLGEMSWGIVRTGEGPLLLAVGRDVSDRRAAERRLRALVTMAEHALAATDAAELTDEAMALLRATLPIASAEVLARDGDSSSVESGGSLRVPIGIDDELAITAGRALDEEDRGLLSAVANILATALARLRAEERMRYEAMHDPLTGLANRMLLRDRLQLALARSERQHDVTGVLFVDLDRFKEINDAYGHGAGDAVLVELGKRLPAAVRPGDTVARFGGDEFVAVCEAVDERSAIAVARRLQEAIGRPFTVSGTEHRLSASIGIALGQRDPDELIGNADSAVYRAKAAEGGGGIQIFG